MFYEPATGQLKTGHAGELFWRQRRRRNPEKKINLLRTGRTSSAVTTTLPEKKLGPI
jgi:hypothetical protein